MMVRLAHTLIHHHRVGIGNASDNGVTPSPRFAASGRPASLGQAALGERPARAIGAISPLSDLRAYQSQHSLTADGIVGDQTWWVPAGGAGATLAFLAGLVTV